jgi:hypothetical protein
VAQAITPPGWYPDSAGTGFQWWNGSNWTGQAWQPPPDEELFDVNLLNSGLGPKLRLRGTLMQQLGLSKDNAKALIDSSPCLVATRIAKSAADALIHEIVDMGGNLAEWRSTGMTAGSFLAGVRGSQTPAAAPAPAPTPVPAPPPATGATPGPSPFSRVEAQLLSLVEDMRAGRLTPAQVDQMLYALVFESGGRHWVLRANSLQWYASSGGDWTPATPPT